MRPRGSKLYDLMSSGGAAILLIAWLVQQTYLQETNDRLAKLNSVMTTARVIDSNRLVLQALASMNGADTKNITSLLSDIEQSELSLFDTLQTEHAEAGLTQVPLAGPVFEKFIT